MLEHTHRDSELLVGLAQRPIRRAVNDRIDDAFFFQADRQLVLAVRGALSIQVERAHQSSNRRGTLTVGFFAAGELAPGVWLIYFQPRVARIYRRRDLESE